MAEPITRTDFESGIRNIGPERAFAIASIVGAEYPEFAREIMEVAVTEERLDASRLDAVQESSDARTELYDEVPQGSTGADDEVMRQEFGQSSELSSEAGQNGGGNW